MSEFIDPKVQPPPMEVPLIVYAREFGQDGGLAVVRAWKSSDINASIKYYLDPTFYGDENVRMRSVAEEVRGYFVIPMPTREMMEDI